MPIFSQGLQKIDFNNPQEAIKKLVNHIRVMQEDLEFTLHNLDSRNIVEIETDKTTITDSSGSTNIGSFINLTGSNGEGFRVGRNSSGKFEFSVKSKGGTQVIYLDSSGNVNITKSTNLTIDGGEW